MALDTRKLDQLIRQHPDMLEQGVRAAGEAFAADVKMLIQTSPPTGVTYRRRGISHVASAPGNAPRSDTGTLIGSIMTRPINKETVRIETSLDYAAYLEFLKDRPFFSTVAEDYRNGKFAKVLASLFAAKLK